MGEHDLHRHVQISDDHGTVASADVTITQQTVRTARASLRAAAGHLAPGSRARLVDSVLDLPELHNGGRLEAAFPLGDSETLFRLRQRCTDVTTHPAGSTVLLEATIGPVPAFGRAADWDELGSYAVFQYLPRDQTAPERICPGIAALLTERTGMYEEQRQTCPTGDSTLAPATGPLRKYPPS